ncbi:MAG: UbiD family decarboxylase, partial [Candidatus Micrarchaeota archaeon]
MMREFIAKLEGEGKLVRVKKSVPKKLVAAGIMKALDGKPVLFEKIEGSAFPVVGNLFASKELVASYFGVRKDEILQMMIKAIEKPTEPKVVKNAPCQEVVEESVDLDKLPILTHCPQDGGPYVSSGVVVARDKEYGLNASFHRLMQIGKNRFVMRILPRHLNDFIKRAGGELDVAVCIGNPPNVLLAGATSVDIGINELKIANSFEPLEIVKCKSVDVEVPAGSEFVLEGRITKE